MSQLEYPWLHAYPAGVDWNMDLPAETLPEVLDRAVRRFAERPALDFFGRRWSYAELGAAVDSAAEALRRMGAGPGVRVGLHLPNHPAFVISYFAALKAGATVVAFSPLYVEEGLARQASDSGTSILITLDLEPLLPRALAMLRNPAVPVRKLVVVRFAYALPGVKSLLFRLFKRKQIAAWPTGEVTGEVTDFATLLRGPPLAAPPTLAPDDLAVLQYTGGTTGTPKGAMLSHRNLCANVRQVNAWFAGRDEGQEVALAVIPFFHIFAMTVAMNATLAGGSLLVMLPRFEWPMVRAALRRTRPSILPGVPTLFKAILENGGTAAEIGSIKACLSGGAPLPAQLKADFEAASGCKLVEGYGLTETSPVATCNPLRDDSHAGSIGVPMPGVRIEIRAIDPPHAALPQGERGEVCVHGPNVMQGYWNQPEATAQVLGADGFLRTGDVGIMDADGYTTLVDRIKDLILVSGFNVYPRAVEEAIYRHPDVVACTVVGMPDEHRGEAPAAFVELRPGSVLDVAALHAFLKDKLSPVQMPRLIELRDKLPRTMVGKLSKTELRAEILLRVAR